MGTELDPLLAASGDKNRAPRFALVRRGVDPRQVDDFLINVASGIKTLETQLQQALVTAEPAQAAIPSDDAPDRLTKPVSEIVSVAEHEADTMIAEAKAEAATMVSEARREADRTRSAAQDEADRSVQEARSFLERSKEESDQALSELAERRRQMIEALQQTQKRVLGVAHELELEPSGRIQACPAAPPVPEPRSR